MATGVTAKAGKTLTAWNFLGEAETLPAEAEVASLAYPHKLSAESLLAKAHREFLSVTNREVQPIDRIPRNVFVLDDNLAVLRQLVEQKTKVNLFYLDPPYGTGFDFQTRDLLHSYADSMGQAEYLEFIRRRLILMRECMADDASIYVHIGHQMVGHLKVVMDEIFGANKCRNIITRRKCSSKNFTKKQFANINDFILFYTKGEEYTWRQPGVAPEQDWIDREYPKVDQLGRRYKLVPVHAPGIRNGETGKSWRGKLPPKGKHWQYPPSKLDQLDSQGDIHWSRNANPRRKVYLTSDKKLPLTDYWHDYRDAHHQSIKITGYPTEKNLQMLEMIVSASSNAGDLVVDPFCGSGTLMQAARDQGRSYIGIDASFVAARTSLMRMRYGADSMGDYVQARSKQALQMVLKYETDSVECGLLTERRLWEAFSKEIREIAAV